MNTNIIKGKGSYFLVLLLSLSVMFLSNSYLLFIAGLFCWVMIFMNGKKEFSGNIIFIKMMILSIPLSFTNIWGGDYGDSILSWYNIFFVILFIKVILKSIFMVDLKLDFLSVSTISLIIISFIPLIKSMSFIDGLEQYTNLSIPLVMILVGNSIKNTLTQYQITSLLQEYINATKIAAIGLIIQYFFVKLLGVNIGNYEFLGGYRHSYGFLFTDVSFLSLFLVSGAVMLYFSKEELRGNRFFWVSNITFLLIASILTSARTGIVSFILVFSIYCFFRIFKLLEKGSLNAILISIFNVIIIYVSYILVLETRGTANLSDSGRGSLNEVAYNIFLQNPIFGVGFGKNSYTSTIGTLPHNIFFQSVAQGGLIYTLPLLLFLLIVFMKAYKSKGVLFPVLLCVFIGSLFVPNIFNSRFLSLIFLLVPLESYISSKRVRFFQKDI